MRYYNEESYRKNPFEFIYRSFSVDMVPVFPRVVDVELTNYCNLSCLFCGQRTMTRNKGYMSDDVFDKILDECSRYTTPIRFIRWGEPFLHKKIIPYIEKAKKNDMLVHVTSNLLALDYLDIPHVINSGVDSITFSMQGATKKEYEHVRDNMRYDEFVDKLVTFSEYRNYYEKPYIQLSSTMINDTKKEIKRFVDKFIGYVDLISIGKTDIDRTKETNTDNLMYNCPEFFNKISIDWNGDITACCSDYDGFLTLGNINKNNIKDIWNSDDLNALRTLMRNKRNKTISLCSHCHPTRTENE